MFLALSFFDCSEREFGVPGPGVVPYVGVRRRAMVVAQSFFADLVRVLE